MQTVTNPIIDSLNTGLFTALAFLPSFLSGIIVLLIGIIVASIVKAIIHGIFKTLKLDAYFKRYGIPEAKHEFHWSNILAEIIRWFVIVLFLIPTAEIWNLPQVAHILNTFLLYIPNVFVAAIIGLVGLVFARLLSDFVHASTGHLAPDIARTLASAVRISITVFVLLAVLNQLGVAQDLIRILFTGVVAMVALAGGIAFGLGGKDLAHTLLESIRKKIK